MKKNIFMVICILFVFIYTSSCLSNTSITYEKDNDTKPIIYDEYEIELISCKYDEFVGLVKCTFEIERLDGTSKGIESVKCSWGENENYYLMPCATGEVEKKAEYDSEQKKKYITLEQVARIWENDESKGTIKLYDKDESVGVFELIPDEIEVSIISIDENKELYITQNGICAKGDFLFGLDAQLVIVYEDGEKLKIVENGVVNHSIGKWGSSSGSGSNVYTFIFYEAIDKGVEEIIFNGILKEYSQ